MRCRPAILPALSNVISVCLLSGFLATARAATPERPMPPTTAQPSPPPAPASRLGMELTFTDPSGGMLGTRNVEVSLGKTETVSIQQTGRTVSAEISVRAATRAGCHRIEVTLRDKTINTSGQFNKTVWESFSEPCGEASFTLGPKGETRMRVNVRPLR